MKKTASCIVVASLFLSLFASTFNIQPTKAGGTIYIKADGSIEPPTTPIATSDNSTYTFTDDIYDAIVVERNNIIINGNGHTLQGASGRGIDLSHRTNVIVRCTLINGFYYGVYLYSSDHNILSGNNLTNSGLYGIYLYGSDNNTIGGNNIVASAVSGVYLEQGSNNNSVRENNISSNGYGIYAIWNCDNNQVSGNNVTSKWCGVYLERYSDNNSVSRNHVTSGEWGILVGILTGYNNIDRNNVIGGGDYVVFLDISHDNSVRGNHITATNGHAVYLDEDSVNNSISRNDITATRGNGVYLDVKSNFNSVNGNNIMACGMYGIYICNSSSNIVYHNSFINNTLQGLTTNSANTWDDGLEGNYWSDYAGVDSNYDGIGDTSYIIDGNNKDDYPLMSPYVLGDYNHDGIVNMTDVNLVRAAWLFRQGDLNYNPHTDFTRDGIINIKDATAIGINWLKHA